MGRKKTPGTDGADAGAAEAARPKAAKKPAKHKPSQFRLSPETLAAIDRIGAHYGGINRSDAIRVAVRNEEMRLSGAGGKIPGKIPIVS